MTMDNEKKKWVDDKAAEILKTGKRPKASKQSKIDKPGKRDGWINSSK
jgi:hypothetical protein